MHPSLVAGVALVAFATTEFVLRRGTTAKRLRPEASDRGTTPMIFGCYALVIFLLTARPLPASVLPRAVAWTGVALAFAGLVVRWWAMLILGPFYTRTLTTTPDQGVVRRGPYRWVRHPGYLGSLITWLGAGLASGNAVLAVLVFAVLLFAYSRRIEAEEIMLTERLGQSYLDYRRTTWRLLPPLF